MLYSATLTPVAWGFVGSSPGVMTMNVTMAIISNRLAVHGSTGHNSTQGGASSLSESYLEQNEMSATKTARPQKSDKTTIVVSAKSVADDSYSENVEVVNTSAASGISVSKASRRKATVTVRFGRDDNTLGDDANAVEFSHSTWI